MKPFKEVPITGWEDPDTKVVYTWVEDYITHYPTLRPLDRFGRVWWMRNKDVLNAIKRWLPKDGLFADIGAHHGEYVLVAAHRGARTIAFEPDPTSFEILRRNTLKVNPAQVTIRNVAISDHNDTLPFSRMPNSACSGFKPWKVGNVLEEIEMQCLTPRKAIPVCPDLVKIDVEGHEISVLNGMASAGYRCAMIVEPHSADPQEDRGIEAIVAWAQENGYDVGNVDINGFLQRDIRYELRNRQMLLLPR